MTERPPPISELVQAIREGHRSAQNAVLARFTPWLTLLARQQIDTRLQRKFDASDVVQQALLEAHRAFPKFRGGTQAELAAWLRTILAHVLAHEVRRYKGAQRRDVGREVSLEQSLTQTSNRLADLLIAPGSSPSEHQVRSEESLLLAQALESLPEDYRQVIILRNLEDLSHDEIASRMNRSAGAVRMLWVRALARLRQEMEV